MMNNPPVHYHSPPKARSTIPITTGWVHTKALPEIRKYQIKHLQLPEDKIKALILLHNAPTHPDAETLCSRDKEIKCMFLPSNTTAVFQSMDQGVIYMAKLIDKKKFLNEVLEVEKPLHG